MNCVYRWFSCVNERLLTSWLPRSILRRFLSVSYAVLYKPLVIQFIMVNINQITWIANSLIRNAFLCRIIVQNERYDDWTSTTVTLKSIFHEYLNGYFLLFSQSILKFCFAFWFLCCIFRLFALLCNRLLKCHEAEGLKPGLARISSACDGNFLEVLNMGLNGVWLISVLSHI